MRIIYGVSGEGFGHSSRAKEIISFLLKKKHEVLILAYGKAYTILRDFKGIKILKIQGIEMFFEKGKELSLKKTVFYNLQSLLNNIKNFREIKNKVDKFKPDIYISDMEPIVPILSYLKKLPLISIDNQHLLTHFSINVPWKYQKEYRIAKEAIRMVAPRANSYIILSFTREGLKDKSGRAYLVDPILRKSVLRLKRKKGNYTLVYLTRKDKKIIEILKGVDEKFLVYGYDVERKESNLIFRKTGEGFLKDLAGAKAVVASAGFSLISEALYLGKPYFAIPLKGQFEQTINALYLKKSGLGEFSEEPTKKDIEAFLSRLQIYRKKLQEKKINPEEVFMVLDRVLEELK